MLQSANDFRQIASKDILEPPHQLRSTIDPERLGELADSMSAEGLHQPIGVRGPNDEGKFEIIWGHRRFLASRLLQWSTISARVFSPDFDPLLAAISENLQRVDLDPVEEARAVHKLLHQGKAIAEIARLFRRSQAWISSRLELLGFHADLIEAIQHHGLKLTVAQALQDVDHVEYRMELIREALRTGATGPTAQVWRQHYLADKDRITRNHLVVEEIISRRESWTVYVPCDGCGENSDYRETQAWRFCGKCSHELRSQIDQPQETLNGSASQSSDIAPTHMAASQAGTAPQSETRRLAADPLPGI